jgi:hypothetical protein
VRISRRTLTIKSEQQNLHYVICIYFFEQGTVPKDRDGALILSGEITTDTQDLKKK